ncbi:MAG: ATP-binding protein, partial [Myxococcales bacterium]|nr:ATP-binding protein [Myxococcales bacterium]
RREDRLILEVDDDGPGVDPADSERIFDRFFTGPRPEAEHRGTGLGLALVKAIAQAHGGHVDVDRSPDDGARFRLTLPYSAPGPR